MWFFRVKYEISTDPRAQIRRLQNAPTSNCLSAGAAAADNILQRHNYQVVRDKKNERSYGYPYTQLTRRQEIILSPEVYYPSVPHSIILFTKLDNHVLFAIIMVLELVARPRFNLTGVGDSPPLFLPNGDSRMNLSIFLDESGDIGEYQPHSPYYVITMVFHDQSYDLTDHLKRLDQELSYLGYDNMAIHTEPLVRREEAYSNLSPNERRQLFTKLFFFALRSPIQYKSFVFEKKQMQDVLHLEARMAKEISSFIREHISMFQKYDNVILYYDNGQRIITRIMNTVLATELSQYEVRKVYPKDYRLFQVADLLCTISLTQKKLQNKDLSRSEKLLFH